MTCRHEWVRYEYSHRCACGEALAGSEITKRLNEYETLKRATEALSAEDADKIAEMLTDWAMSDIGIIYEKKAVDMLCAYARILSGDNDETE